MFKREKPSYRETPELSDQEVQLLNGLGGITNYNRIYVISYLRLIEQAIGSSVSGRRILDIGCGSTERDYRGRRSTRPPILPLVLAMRGAKAYGIDPGDQDSEHLQYIRDHGGEISQHTLQSFHTLLEQDKNPFRLRNGFDVVVTNDVFGYNADPSHIPLEGYEHDPTSSESVDLQSQRNLYMDVCTKVLRPGGIALRDWDPDKGLFDYPRLLYTSWQKPEEPRRSLIGHIFGGQ